jgi:arsenate reductase
MSKKSVLFLCVHNSARSQMAAAFLNQLASDRFEAESAGLEPRTLNPLAVEAMRRIGIDISQGKTQSVFDLFKAGRRFYYVISVCDEAAAERCPVFAGITKRLSWSFDDPAGFRGTDAEKQSETSRVRDEIRAKVVSWIAEEAKTSATKGRPERPHLLRA